MGGPASRRAARACLALAMAAAASAACAARETNLSLSGAAGAPPADAATAHDATSDSSDGSADGGAVVVFEDASAADAPDAPACVVGGTSETLPVTVACGQPSPAHFVFDDTYVYWTVQGGKAIVSKAPRAGGAVEVLVYDDSSAVGVAVDAQFVYYAQPARGRVMRVPLDGGLPETLADGLDFPLFLARDATSLYWTGGVTDGKVMKLDLAAGSSPITLVDGQTNPRAIAVAGGFVYWTDVDATDGSILRTADHVDATTDGGTLTAVRLAAGIKGPTDLALAGGYAYAPDQNGRIARVPLAGGALEPFVTVTGVPFGVATDGLALYWSTLGDGGIFSTLIGGDGAVVTLASGEADPRFLAVDDLAVFWGAWGGGGAVRKIAKTGR
jgi:hypothetical protein